MAAQSKQAASAIDIRTLGISAARVDSSPLWPYYLMLRGEVYRLRDDIDNARNDYRQLTEWAAADPYRDGYGGSSIAAVALWRWLQILTASEHPDAVDADRLLRTYQHLRETRLVRRLFAFPILDSVPQLQEDIVRGLARLEWLLGRTNEAQRFFLDYLTITTMSNLGPLETELKQQVLDSGLATGDRLNLLRGERLFTYGRYADAGALLDAAYMSRDSQVRAVAALYLAKLHEIMGDRSDVVNLLTTALETATDPHVAEEALYTRGIFANHEGANRDVARFKSDMTSLIAQFSRGSHTGDALYELARYFQENGDVDTALRYYARLRALNTLDATLAGLAAFEPAMALYTKHHPGDIAEASALLEALQRNQPFGPFYFASLFWLGRMAAESGKGEESVHYFRRIIEESPYNYYAIRARMHLSVGMRASGSLWPDSETSRALNNAYRTSHVASTFADASAYHRRLRATLDTGFYAATIAAYRRLRRAVPPERLEDVPLNELDGAGLLVPVTLLLALRQDAFAAADAVPTAENRLRVAGAVGQVAHDWPLVMDLVTASDESLEQRAETQRDDRYLATAYPRIFRRPLLQVSTTHHVPPELLYSVIRIESLFDPEALSPSGALGLFQFVPATFEALDRRWKLLRTSGSPSRPAFLMNPVLSVDLGARWFAEELLPRYRENILFAVMDHNAGASAVLAWRKRWTELGRTNDMEYMVDTVRFLETREFAQSVVTEMVIVRSAGILQ